MGVAGAAAGAAGALGGCSVPTGAAITGDVWERPPNQRDEGNCQNLIFLNTDALRADDLQAYGGNGPVKCPKLDNFAEDSVP